jgi:hypothetical protein
MASAWSKCAGEVCFCRQLPRLTRPKPPKAGCNETVSAPPSEDMTLIPSEYSKATNHRDNILDDGEQQKKYVLAFWNWSILTTDFVTKSTIDTMRAACEVLLAVREK